MSKVLSRRVKPVESMLGRGETSINLVMQVAGMNIVEFAKHLKKKCKPFVAEEKDLNPQKTLSNTAHQVVIVYAMMRSRSLKMLIRLRSESA